MEESKTMEIVKVYKQSLPRVKLVGKCYTNKDRDESGTFARYWQQCFSEGWLDKLKFSDAIPDVSEDLVGAMRMNGEDGDFEYWIGAFLTPSATVPEGGSRRRIFRPGRSGFAGFVATIKTASCLAWRRRIKRWPRWQRKVGSSRIKDGSSSAIIARALPSPTKRAMSSWTFVHI